MLDDLQKYNDFGNKRELEFLLFNVLSNTPKRIDDVIQFSISNIFSISRSIRGAISLLKFLDLVIILDNKIVLNKNNFSNSKQSPDCFFERDFFILLFDKLKNTQILTELFNRDTLKFNSKKNQYFLKGNLIHPHLYSFRNLLINTKFLYEDSATPALYDIPEHLTDIIQRSVLPELIRLYTKHTLSLKTLEESLEARKEAGRLGEEFVLRYEKERLNGHRLIDMVEIISATHVNAGYDIKSFKDFDSIFQDMFIEVKTHSGTLEFYWSKNEIKIAQELQTDYYLYLVDSHSLDKHDYMPIVIQNPYEKIFLQDLLEKEVETWKVSFHHSRI